MHLVKPYYKKRIKTGLLSTRYLTYYYGQIEVKLSQPRATNRCWLVTEWTVANSIGF